MTDNAHKRGHNFHFVALNEIINIHILTHTHTAGEEWKQRCNIKEYNTKK